MLRGDLLDTECLPGLVADAVRTWGRLDLLVNNASSFYATPVGATDEAAWDDLLGTNLKAPFFLAQAAAPHLAESRGSIVNITDIHGARPLGGYTVYSAAKAGLLALTRGLAQDLGPEVRVNAVSPGAVLWAEQETDEAARAAVLARTALGRIGTPDDIARAVVFLARDALYCSGTVIDVDGGRY